MERCSDQCIPDCQAKFGLLTDVIQVKAELALKQMTRNGLLVDLNQLKALVEKTETDARKAVDEINSLAHFSVCFPHSQRLSGCF